MEKFKKTLKISARLWKKAMTLRILKNKTKRLKLKRSMMNKIKLSKHQTFLVGLVGIGEDNVFQK
jgi:hypothetical protein